MHLFKNAGTSIDRILKQNFGSQWMSYDEDQSGKIICSNQFEKVVRVHQNIQAFSSHQLVPPFPNNEFTVFPIVFIRHPLERIKSAYLFEWKKQLGLDSPRGSLQEYIDEKLQHRRRNVIEEFQTMRLSNSGRTNFQNIDQYSDCDLLDRAKKLLNQLPCVGVVDRFDESIEKIENCAKRYWPHIEFFTAQENVSQSTNLPMLEKLDAIREELGEYSYYRIADANKLDLQLYDYACKLLEAKQVEDQCVVKGSI